MDVAATHAGAPSISLWRNVEGNHFERVSLSTGGALEAWELTQLDIHNDRWIDLAAIVEDPAGSRLRVFRNLVPRGLKMSRDPSASLTSISPALDP